MCSIAKAGSRPRSRPATASPSSARVRGTARTRSTHSRSDYPTAGASSRAPPALTAAPRPTARLDGDEVRDGQIEIGDVLGRCRPGVYDPGVCAVAGPSDAGHSAHAGWQTQPVRADAEIIRREAGSLGHLARL